MRDCTSAESEDAAADDLDQRGSPVGAAWLYDVGYAPQLAAATGFHVLDGARYLRVLGAPKRLVDLVARHSCAGWEAGCASWRRR